MLGTQLLVSATPLMRSHILPPSEMKSLYGSITTSAVISFSYVSFVSAISQPFSVASYFVSAARCETGPHSIPADFQQRNLSDARNSISHCQLNHSLNVSVSCYDLLARELNLGF